MTGAAGVTEDAFLAKPRNPTVLARYSRSSKLKVSGLLLVGILAISYVIGHSIALRHQASNHVPRILGSDSLKNNVFGAIANGQSRMLSRGGSGSTSTQNSQDDTSIPMAPAPDPDLTESTSQGDLPRISEDGRQPWQVYARPYNTADPRPRVAIIVGDLGKARVDTEAAVSQLPTNVTLAFDVQGTAIAAWCNRARQTGHEVMLSVPMEPFDYPRSDPGPHTLLTTLANRTNIEKLNWSLRQATGYVGITSMTGSRFTTDSGKLQAIMDVLHDRGLMVLDARSAPHGVVTALAHQESVPVATANVRIDENLSPEAINASFHQLEQTARLTGHAVGIVPPLPNVISLLQAWLKTLPQQGISLAPVSAVVQ